MEYSELPLLQRSWVFKCGFCHSSMSIVKADVIGLSLLCPLCRGRMTLHPEASLIYQRKEAESN
jgi:hypothetical protein